MGNIYNSRERDAFDFMYNNKTLSWYEGGYEQFVKDFGENNKKAPFNTSDYWNARNMKISQAIANFKSQDSLKDAAKNNFQYIIEQTLKEGRYDPILEDYANTRDSMLRLNEIIHNKEGKFMVFDTETLGDTGRIQPGGGVGITEIGYAIKNGNGEEIHKTAVYGINDEQYNNLLNLYNKFKDEGYDSLNKTEQSTIERLSRYRGITNKVTYDQSLKSYVIRQGEVLADSDIHSLKPVMEGLKALHTLGVGEKGNPYYSGTKGMEEGMNEVIKFIDSYMQDPDTPVMAKNKGFDINTIENAAIRSQRSGGSLKGFTGGSWLANAKTIDIQTMTDMTALYHGYTIGHMNAEASGGRLYSEGGNTLTTYFEIQNGGYKEFPAHVAGEDSLVTAQFAMFKNYDKAMPGSSLIDLAERTYDEYEKYMNDDSYTSIATQRMFESSSGTDINFQDLEKSGVYLKSGVHDRRNDFFTIINENGEEEMLKGFSGTNQFWILDDYKIVTLDPVSLTAKKNPDFTKEVVPERKGVMLKFTNDMDERISLYKFFPMEDKSIEGTIKKAGEWLYWNSDVSTAPISKEYAEMQYDMSVREAARRDIVSMFSAKDAGVVYYTDSNGNKIKERYNADNVPDYLKNYTLTKGVYKHSGGYAEAEKYYYAIQQITDLSDKVIMDKTKKGIDRFTIIKKGEDIPKGIEKDKKIRIFDAKDNKELVAKAIHNHIGEQWIRDVFDYNQISARSDYEYEKIGYVAAGISDRLELIGDVISEVDKIDPMKQPDSGKKPLTNMQKTAILDIVNQKAHDKFFRLGNHSIDYYKPPLEEVSYSFADIGSLPIFDSNGNRHFIDFRAGDRSASSALARIARIGADTEYDATINLRNIAENLADHGVINYNKITEFDRMYGKNHPYEYARDIINSISPTMDKIIRLAEFNGNNDYPDVIKSVKQYNNLFKTVSRIDELLQKSSRGLELMEKQGMDFETVNLLKYKYEAGGVYDEADKYINREFAYKGKRLEDSIYPNNRFHNFYRTSTSVMNGIIKEAAENTINNKLTYKDSQYDRSDFSFLLEQGENAKKIYESRGGITLTKGNVAYDGTIFKPGDKITTYEELFKYLGYDTSMSGKGFSGGSIDTILKGLEDNGNPEKGWAGKEYAISKQEYKDMGFKYGIVGTENGAYIFGTNAQTEAEVYKIISQMTGNESHEWIKNNLGKYAGYYRIHKVTNRLVGTGGDNVPPEVSKVIGRNNHILLSSIDTDSGLPMYLPYEFNIFMGSDKKIHGQIRPMTDVVAESIRRGGMERFVQKNIEGDFAGATAVFKKNQDNVLQEAVMSDSFLTSMREDTVKKAASFNMVDVLKAYEMKFEGVEELMKRILEVNDKSIFEPYDFDAQKIRDMAALYNIATETVVDKNNVIVTNFTTRKDINKLTNDRMFREFYVKSLSTRSVGAEPAIINAIINDNQKKSMMQNVLGIDLSDIKTKEDAEKLLTEHFSVNGKDGTIINLVNEAINNYSGDRIDKNVKEGMKDIARASKYISGLTTISAVDKGVFPFKNIAYMNSASSDSSTIRPTAVSMNRYHTFHDSEITFDNKKYDINLGMSSMQEQLFKDLAYMTVENGIGDRPISITNDGEHYYLNPEVKDWNTQHVSMQMPFSNIDQQTAAERLNDKEIIKRMISDSKKKTTIANATYGNNLNTVLANYFSDRYKEIAQFHEGKIILASDIYRDPFFAKSEVKKFYSSDFYEFSRQGFEAEIDKNGIIKMVNGNEDFENTISIINQILEDPYNKEVKKGTLLQNTKIREGDLIGVLNGKDIRFHGLESNFSAQDALSLLNTGKMYVNDDVSAVGDMKINLGQEKNTATGLDIDLLLSRLDVDGNGKYYIEINGKKRAFSEEQIRATNEMIYDVLSGWAYQIVGENKKNRMNILRPGAIASMDPGKHNLAISLETQWGIVTRTYQEAVEHIDDNIKNQRAFILSLSDENKIKTEERKLKNMIRVRDNIEESIVESLNNIEVETRNNGKYSFGKMINAHIGKDASGQRMLLYNLKSAEKYDNHGMAQGIYETVNAIRDNRFGYTNNSKYLPYNINETIMNRIANAMKMHGGYVDMYLVNMRQATSDEFVIDSRISEAFKRKAFSDPYKGYGDNKNLEFHESGLPLSESTQYKLIEELKSNIKNGKYIDNYGTMPFNKSHTKIFVTKEDKEAAKRAMKLSEITYDLTNKYSNKPIHSRDFEERILNGIKRAIGYYGDIGNNNSEYTKIPEGNFLVLDGFELFSHIPKSGADMKEYQNFIYRIDGNVSGYLRDEAKRNNISMIDDIENVVVSMKPFKVNHKKEQTIDKVVLPVYNLSSTHDELWLSKGASSVTAFLNAAANYSKAMTDEELIEMLGYTPAQIKSKYGKDIKNFTANDYIEQEYDRLIRALEQDTEPRNRESLAAKITGRYKVPNGTEMLAISDTTFGIKPNSELANAANAVNDALTELEVRKFIDPSDPISPDDILDLSKKIKTRKNVFEEYANSLLAIDNGLMAGYTGSKGIGSWLIERGIIGYDPKLYGDLFRVINGKEVMVNMVEAGEAVFKKAGINFGEVGMQLFEDVSLNGSLTMFDSETRFGGKKFKVDQKQVIAEWKGKMTEAFRDDANLLSFINNVHEAGDINESLELMRKHILGVDELSDFDLAKLGLKNKKPEFSSDYISAMNKRNMMSTERKYALNKLVKANEEAFSGLARRYFTEVGVYGLAERYPVFGSSSTMTTKIYLDKENTLGVGIRYFGPQFPSFLHVDFDADNVFLMFNTNGGLFSKNDRTNLLFKEEFEHEALMNAKVLVAHFKDQANGNILNNPSDAIFWRVNRLRKGYIVSNESTAYKEYEKAMEAYVNTLPKNIRERYNAGEESIVEAVTYAGAFDKGVIDVINKYDFNVLESMENKIATLKSEETKANVGFISNAARDVNFTMTALYEMSNSETERRKIARIIRSLDVIDFSEDMTSFGNVALLNIAEQAGIDVKKVFDALELSPTTNIRQGIISLFAASGRTWKGRNAAENKRKAQFAALKEILYATKPQMFSKDKITDDTFVNATNMILDYGYEHIISNSKKHAERLGVSEEMVKKLAMYRSLFEATEMENAYDIFNNVFTNSNSKRDKDLWVVANKIIEGFDTYKNHGNSDVSTYIKAANSSPVYDEKLIVLPNELYFTKPMYDTSTGTIMSKGYISDREGIQKNNKGTLSLLMINVDTYRSNRQKGVRIKGDSIADINETFRRFFPDGDANVTYNTWKNMTDNERLNLRFDIDKRNVSEDVIDVILNAPSDYSLEERIEKYSPGLASGISDLFHVELDEKPKPYTIQDWDFKVKDQYKGIIDEQIGSIRKHINTIDMIEYSRGTQNAENVAGTMVKALNDNIKRKVRNNEWGNEDTVLGEFENIVTQYIDSNHVDAEEYMKIFNGIGSEKKAYNIAGSSNRAILNAKIDIDAYNKSLEDHFRRLNDFIGSIREEPEYDENTINVFENTIQAAQEKFEERRKEFEAQNTRMTDEAFNTLIGGFKKSKIDNYAEFLGHENVYDLNTKQILDNPDFDKAIIGYGEFSTRTMASLSKDEFERLSKELANDKLINKPSNINMAYESASNLFDAFKASGLDENLGNAIPNEATKAEQDVMKDAVDELLNNMLNFEVPDEEEVAEKIKKNVQEASKSKTKSRTVTGSILNALKDFKPDKNAIKASAAALALMIAPAILGNIAHNLSDSDRTGDPITPHSVATEGTNPYTGDPINEDEAPMAEGGRAYSAADTQIDDTKQRVAPPSQPRQKQPIFGRNIYVDKPTGYKFKVSAQTKTMLDKRATQRALAANGINNGRISSYSDNSRITDSWLQSKFAQYM